AGARAEVDYVIGAANRLLVMFNNQDGISQIAQSFQSGKQTIVIARMQADGRLVEHVEHAPETRPDLRGQPNALRLSSRKGCRRTRERQVSQPYVQQKIDALRNF